MDPKNSYFEECAISYLPVSLGETVKRSGALYRGSINEIRLRKDSFMMLTAGTTNICTPYRCRAEDISYTVRALCGNSLYSHSETIKEGYICTDAGIRAGVCGRAVTEGGRIISVTDITSVVIRIPHRLPGASDEICKLIMKEGFRGMMIYSPPGGGKTTALREIVSRLGSKPYSMRIAVIDTRFEICGGLSGDLSVDCLSGYPRAKGMETAIRTLSPSLIVCDEVGSCEDSEAIRESFGSGVSCVVSAHAKNAEELFEKAYIKDLFELGVFSHAVGLKRKTGGFELCVSEIGKKG